MCGMDLRSGVGRTIGPKYGTELMQGFSLSQGAAVAAFMADGCALFNLCVKHLLGMLWAGNSRGLRVH